VRAEALARLSSGIDAGAFADRREPTRLLVVWNLSLDPRPLRAELPLATEALGPKGDVRLGTSDGREVAWQATADGIVVDDPDVIVPPMGYLALSATPVGDATADSAELDAAATDPATAGASSAAPPAELEVAPDRIANARLEVRIAEDGTLDALIDRSTGRNLLAGPGDRLIAYPDLPRFFEAWELDPDDADGAVDLRLEAPPEVIETGPLRAAVRLRRATDGLRVVQDLRLTRHGDRLEIVTRIDVRGRRLLLKSLTTLDVRSETASFETAFGAVERPTHRNTSWDAARFEVPGHRWADLSDGRGGVALLDDGRYGHSVEGGTLGLTLIRAPVHPDPFADEGRHEVIYALRPHPAGDRAATVASAHDLNAPLIGAVVAPAGGAAPATRSLLRVEGTGLRLAALKPAEDDGGAVLRLYESTGRPTRGRLRELPPGWTLGPSVDLLERPVDGHGLGDGFDVRGYEVVSVRLDRRGP
jgi:alpha-mannosidase